MSSIPWPARALRILVPLTGVLLVAQYIAGLLTNAYAPSAGFTSNSAFPALNAHYTLGELLGVLGIVLVVVAVCSRSLREIIPAVVTFIAILVAGVAGMDFVHAQPNPPAATVAMGLAFLVAFATVMAWNFRIMRRTAPAAGPVGGTPTA